jgi:Ca-activated chloride channel homolog
VIRFALPKKAHQLLGLAMKAINAVCIFGCLVLLAITLTSTPTISRIERAPDVDCNKDLIFVFDASGSMGTTDMIAMIPHIERVKRAFRSIISEIPESRRMGLIVYGEGAYNQCDSIELKVPLQRNAGAAMLAEIQKIQPAGRTPLTEAVRRAANLLDFRRNPAVIVLLTDGDETCSGKPCELGEIFRESARDLTVHVIGYRHAAQSGIEGAFEARCLAEETGGLYLPVESEEQIADALRKVLTCPMTTEDSGASTRLSRVDGP